MNWFRVSWEQFQVIDFFIRWFVVLFVLVYYWHMQRRIRTLENLLRWDLSEMARASEGQKGKRCGS